MSDWINNKAITSNLNEFRNLHSQNATVAAEIVPKSEKNAQDIVKTVL